MECSAVLTEVYIINDIFGEVEANEYLLKRFEAPQLWVYNAIPKSLKIAAGSNVSLELMLAIISNSLIYRSCSTGDESNPVKRFIVFYNELKKLNKKVPSSMEEIKEWICDVIMRNGWTSNNIVANEQIEFCKMQIKEFKNSALNEKRDLDTLEEYAISYLESQMFFFEKYKEDILFWSNNYFYLELPKPPIIEFDIDQRKIRMESELALRWFSLVDIIDQLFTKNAQEFICPFKSTKQCDMQVANCGELPLQMPPYHPECWYLVTACELQAPNWKLAIRGT